jgi:hypothetical protein
LSDTDYLAKLSAAGFEGADIEVTRVYTVEDAKEFLAGQCADLQQIAKQVDGKFVSGFIRAVKPGGLQPARKAAAGAAAAGACCGPKCCN